MTVSPVYTDKEKEELTRLFAGALYDAIWEPRPAKIEKMADKLLAEARKLDWFRYEGNRYGILRHLEEAGVYGVFDFFPEKQAKLYLRAVFSERFQKYGRQVGLPREKFVKGLADPKSGAQKPTEAMKRGDVSSTGSKRMNMRSPFGKK